MNDTLELHGRGAVAPDNSDSEYEIGYDSHADPPNPTTLDAMLIEADE